MADLTPDQLEALEIARKLVDYGVPVFVAPPNPAKETGFDLPSKWQTARPVRDVVDRWRPGWALCAVMGHGVDGVDTDPRHDGDKSRQALIDAGMWPRAYGVAATPSGGTHELVAPLNVASMNDVRPGIDVTHAADLVRTSP